MIKILKMKAMKKVWYLTRLSSGLSAKDLATLWRTTVPHCGVSICWQPGLRRSLCSHDARQVLSRKTPQKKDCFSCHLVRQ